MLTTRKAQELDVVELIEDLPEFGLKKGERGTVVVAFSNPDEAYDLEFVDESGTSSRFAYSVKPNQIKSTDEILRDDYEKGMKLLNEGNLLEAEQSFKRAVELKPDSLGNLHNSILEFHKSAVKGTGSLAELESLVAGLRFVLRINPNFKLAKYNIAILYMKYGFHKAMEGDINTALNFYRQALGIELPEDVRSGLKTNFAAAYTSLSIQAQRSGDLAKALDFSLKACEVDTNDITRHNLGASYANLGWYYLNRREFKQAIRLLESAQDTGLLVSELFNNYGVALASFGHLDIAAIAFEKALELSPQDTVARSNLLAVEQVITNSARSEDLHTRIAEVIPISPIPPPIQPLLAAA